MPFTEGVDVRSGGLAKVKRGRYAPLLMWMFGLLAFLVARGEILLRLYAPSMSLPVQPRSRQLPEYADLPDAAILEQVTYRAGAGLSRLTAG